MQTTFARPGTDPDRFYMMPAIVGRPRTAASTEGTAYRDVLSMSVTYLTHRAAVEQLLPPGFSAGRDPDRDPIVGVSYSRNRGVDWLAGAGYNIVGVNVAATFEGKEDRVSGTYCIILWENLTEPILTGRELQGIPKVHADIPDPLVEGERVWARASKNGSPIVELELTELEAYSSEKVAEFQAQAAGGNWMGWRYIPKIGAPGAEISEPTLFPTGAQYESVQSGTGRVRFFPSTFAENPTQYQVINLLCELEPLEYRAAFRTQGSSRLFGSQVRVLR